MREPTVERVVLTDADGRESDVAEFSLEAKFGARTSILVRAVGGAAPRPLREGERITIHQTVTLP